MTKDSTEISVSAEGFGFKTDGEASERLANAALDFLSPLTEGAGFLGTKLRGYRMEAALKATIRAKQICEENDLPINPVPPKFLLQWVEGASMEEIGSGEDLSELWAQILANTSTAFDPSYLVFIDYLKKLSREHVEYLNSFVSDKDATPLDAATVFLTEPNMLADHLTSSYNELCHSADGEDIKLQDLLEDTEGELNQFMDKRGVLFLSATVFIQSSFRTVESEGKQVLTCSNSISWKDKPDNIIHALDALNIIRRQQFNHTFSEKHGAFVDYLHLTSFGWQFLAACGVLRDTIST